jgi:hypothetical protein
MLLTENQAQDRWCPYSPRNPNIERVCIASACMAWRTEDIERAVARKRDDGDRRECWAIAAEVTDKLRGYCGLAGRP